MVLRRLFYNGSHQAERPPRLGGAWRGSIGKCISDCFSIVLKFHGQSQPASATLRNIFEKDLSRSQEIEFFSRSGINNRALTWFIVQTVVSVL